MSYKLLDYSLTVIMFTGAGAGAGLKTGRLRNPPVLHAA